MSRIKVISRTASPRERVWKMRKVEVFIVLIVALLGLVFTFSFGNLIASDHTAGVLGIPFLIFLLIYCSILIFSNNGLTRLLMRVVISLYLMTLISYSLTILYLKSITSDTFTYLYSSKAGEANLAESLLNSFCAAGIVITVFVVLIVKRKGANR